MASLRPDAMESHRSGTRLAWLVFVAGMVALSIAAWVGSVGAYAFLGLWLLFFFVYPRSSVAALSAWPQVWILPGLAVISTLWSEAPALTLRFSLQFAATVGCACIAARMLGPRRLISGLMCALTATMLLSLAAGRHLVDPLTGSVEFVGIFHSKNALAGHIAILILASVAVLLDRRQPPAFRLLAMVSFMTALPVLQTARSAGALVGSAVAVVALLASYALSRLPTRDRMLLLLAVGATLLPVIALLAYLGETARTLVIEDLLGKDPTLTGRTELWQRAAVLIADRPLLGRGFQAFWRQDYVEAEGIWRAFHMPSRSGFNFHNLYIEATVGLGYVGTIVLACLIALVVLRILRFSNEDGTIASSFYVALTILFVVRSFVEVELLYQFTIQTFLFFVTMFFAHDRPSAAPKGALRPMRARAPASPLP